MLVLSLPTLRRAPPKLPRPLLLPSISCLPEVIFQSGIVGVREKSSIMASLLRRCYKVNDVREDFGQCFFDPRDGLETFFYLGFYFAHGLVRGRTRQDKTFFLWIAARVLAPWKTPYPFFGRQKWVSRPNTADSVFFFFQIHFGFLRRSARFRQKSEKCVPPNMGILTTSPVHIYGSKVTISGLTQPF